MKETFATRSVNFDFQGPIFRLFSHKVVRNCYLIFILHTMFFYRDILELTQASLDDEAEDPDELRVDTQLHDLRAELYHQGDILSRVVRDIHIHHEVHL